ncbi:30591_t:CDS:2 [Gigaspora margarita]|uniref:30591_t:CDS:1 n=1 Tax=Gigaspora margarita TaxID=4874 RepID=A0ABN7UMJ7_GIGMA|nr:30591_t:CDS:2 [Gigaspora margarita]
MENLLQFDKNWETLGFRNAKKIYSSNKVYQGTKLSSNDFAQKYKKKQATPHLQYKNDEVNNSDSINEWKCHNCGFNPNASDPAEFMRDNKLTLNVLKPHGKL